MGVRTRSRSSVRIERRTTDADVGGSNPSRTTCCARGPGNGATCRAQRTRFRCSHRGATSTTLASRSGRPLVTLRGRARVPAHGWCVRRRGFESRRGLARPCGDLGQTGSRTAPRGRSSVVEQRSPKPPTEVRFLSSVRSPGGPLVDVARATGKGQPTAGDGITLEKCQGVSPCGFDPHPFRTRLQSRSHIIIRSTPPPMSRAMAWACSRSLRHPGQLTASYAGFPCSTASSVVRRSPHQAKTAGRPSQMWTSVGWASEGAGRVLMQTL